MIEGSSCQNDGVLVGPFGGVAPNVLEGIPEVAPGWITHDSLRKTPPHQEGKVHLQVPDVSVGFIGWFWILFRSIFGTELMFCVAHTSLVSRTVSSSRLSTASVSMAT